MEYRTIQKDGQVQEEIKKSRFICHAKRVYTEEEARDFISAIKKEHYKANHNCSAFILGEKSQIKRTSDDGEPSGTAGIPILGVLEKHQLTNLCLVVTRYFGGTKLGSGGLIRAYASSAALAVKEIGIAEIKEQAGLRLFMSYSQYQDFSHFLKEENLTEAAAEFTDKVTVTIFVHQENKTSVKNKLTEFFKGKLEIEEAGIKEVELPVI